MRQLFRLSDLAGLVMLSVVSGGSIGSAVYRLKVVAAEKERKSHGKTPSNKTESNLEWQKPSLPTGPYAGVNWQHITVLSLLQGEVDCVAVSDRPHPACRNNTGLYNLN